MFKKENGDGSLGRSFLPEEGRLFLCKSSVF